MKYQRALKWLIVLIGLLALFAAFVGLFWTDNGQPYPFTSHRGETVTLFGRA